jgi:VWFA-related protein
VRALISFVLFTGIAAPFLTAQQGREEGPFTIALNANLVVINVTVTDNKGHYVSGLTANDFQVREDNRVQDITLFTAEDVPATVGLVIDNSGSMLAKRSDVVNAAMEFVGAGNPGDEMCVVNFNENVYLGLPPGMRFTSDRNELRSALLRTTPAGRTALYDALAMGIEQLKSGMRDRKALVVVSDGGDNASRHRLDDVLQMAQRSSATIYTIGIYDDADLDRNPKVLRKIAEMSGGRAYFPESPKDRARVWLDVAGRIRSQYTIGYHSTNPTRDGAYRKVKVTAGRTGGSDLKITARDGYLAASDD